VTAQPEPEIDARKVRSRKRLLDAAASLLNRGGVQAVTVDAVTRVSRVARTTLYRHFDSTTELIAAALERMLPDVVAPPRTGVVRDDLVAALDWLVEQLDQAPVPVTTIAWLAVSLDEGDHVGAAAVVDLRDRLIRQYREPFDAVLRSESTVHEIGEVDGDVAFAQVVGPVLLARLTGDGVVAIDRAGRRRVVDDFLAARTVPVDPDS